MTLANPGYDADMLRRAAEASRNARKSMPRGDWFDWVPEYLDGLAGRIDPAIDVPTEDQ